MAEAATQLAVKSEEKGRERPAVAAGWRPFVSLRREVDRLFDEFNAGSWRFPFRHWPMEGEPFWRRDLTWGAIPSVDIAEKDDCYEVTAELPGMEEKDVEVRLSDGALTIKGEKKEEKEEKRKDYYVSERRYGAFQRSFSVPEGIEADKVEAHFKNGVLTVSLPKTPAAQKREKKIAIKAA